MTFKVSEFRTAIKAGSRPNLFEISIVGGSFTTTNAPLVTSLAKASSLPGSTVGMIEVPHLGGRRLKLAGDRTYAEWTVTFMSDAAFNLRRTVETYQASFLNLSFDDSVSVGNRATASTAIITVKQLNDAGAAIRTYTLNNAFATDISSIDLSYDSRDTLEEFTVTWAYDYFDVA